MRFDFSRFLLDIEHRSRRFRGLSLACQLLSYGSLASIAAILGLRLLFPDLGREMISFALAIPLAFGIIAFLIGWQERPNLPHLLIHLDDELESGARISSLYEARLRGHDSFFRQRLERLVEAISSDWKRGLRPHRHTVRFLSAGLSGMLVATIILFIPLPSPSAISMEFPEQSESLAAQLPRSTTPERAHPTGSDETTDPLESREEATSSEDSSHESIEGRSNEDISLDSVLDDLSNLARGQAQVDMPTTSDELLDLANAQAQARQALSEMLQDLQQQMQGSPRPLTQQESRALQDLASQTGDPEIEERTDDIVGEPNPDQMGEKMQDLIEELDPDADTPESTPETNEDTEDGSGQDSPRSTEVASDEEAGQKFLERTAERLEEEANSESQQDGESTRPADSGNEEDSQEPNEDGEVEMMVSGDPEDLSQEGGDDGLGGDSSEGPEPGTVGFIREEAPSTIGEEGESIDEFVTKGVPIEIAPSQDSDNTHFVDFERMDSILQDRDLPEEAKASIRRYFELITQPEGGS
jgi:hypothetical protein